MTQESLKEWYLKYRKNRDIMLKRISSIEENKVPLIIYNKDNTQEIIIINENTSSLIDLLNDISNTFYINIVLLNKKNHIDILIKEWDKLIEYKNLTILFVNPESITEKRWLIKPAIHNTISEKATLKQGIYSIAEAVELC
jgi:hypothetical protein